MQKEVRDIIRANEERLARNSVPFDPITGEHSVGERFEFTLDDFPIKTQWLPMSMNRIPLIRMLKIAGSIKAFFDVMSIKHDSDEAYQADRLKTIAQIVRMRCLHDFPFWAAAYVWIKNKGGGDDVRFKLTRPQRKFVERLEELRLADKPIRLILLKARQWGGSTTSQLYMAWLQLVHRVGLNSLIIAHQGAGSDEIKDMFDRMIKAYPIDMLHEVGDTFNPDDPKLVGVGKSGSIHRVPQRNCKIKIGTAERPDSCRGGDYNLVHLSEVGVWKTTDGKKPEDIVRSACSGILYEPYTMIVLESTANGTGNYFQREYDAAKNNESQFGSLFISWYDIDQYSINFKSDKERDAFAAKLWKYRKSANTMSNRCESGQYLWYLWTLGATLEAINWYVIERAKYSDHGLMASEYPSDDTEAFVHSGARVFDQYHVKAFEKGCRKPQWIGDVYGDGLSGADSMRNIRFTEDAQGQFWIWSKPEVDPDEPMLNRYLVVVDIGGRSNKADYSVIVVFDRLLMMDGGNPVVVAQWYGHTDMDLLAWRSARVAAYYDNALLVIESNTLETHDRNRSVDGDNSGYILNEIKNHYPNLYERPASEAKIAEGISVMYGFQTNTSTKPSIINNLVVAIREHLYVERDKRCLDEYLCYERKQNGAYGAIAGKHDDLLMTRAIGLYVSNQMDLPRIVPRRTPASTRSNPKTAASF